MWWVSAILVLFQIGGVLSSIHALLSVRTSQGTVAWVVSLNTFPLVAVPAYWVFGRNKFNGYVKVRQTADTEVREEVERRAPQLAPYLAPLEVVAAEQVRAAERLAEFPFLIGNEVELLVDGKATFDSILEGMDRAQDYLLVQFFIVKDDRLGRRLQAKMMERARANVTVSFLYDEIGSHALPRRYLDELREAGVRVSPFHSRRGHSNRFQLNFRNHRKIVVADGKVGWVGGHNVGDEYVDGHPVLGAWRDTHVKLTGPAVIGLQLSFAEDWNWATDEALAFSWMPVKSPDGDVPVLIIPSGPADRHETASLMMQKAIHGATRRIWITSPYFVPDEGVSGALHLAVMRGVDVRILIPDEPDHKTVYHAAFAFLGEFVDAGVKIYRYQGGFLHQKVVLVDDHVAGIGTVNLDNRSFRLNFEITALVASEDFAAQVATMLEQDLSRSRLMTREELAAMPLHRRILSRACYLLSPIL